MQSAVEDTAAKTLFEALSKFLLVVLTVFGFWLLCATRQYSYCFAVGKIKSMRSMGRAPCQKKTGGKGPRLHIPFFLKAIRHGYIAF